MGSSNRHFWALALLVLLGTAGVLTAWFYFEPKYDRWRLTSRAEKALAEGKPGVAEELLLPAIKEKTTDPRLHYLYAQALRRLGRAADAVSHLTKAVQFGMSEDAARREYALAEAVADTGHTSNTEGNLQRVLKENPGDTEVIQAIAEFYERADRWVEAERMYTRWLELDPDNIEARLERGRCREKAAIVSGADIPLGSAAEDFRTILERVPNHFRARLLLGHVLLSDARMAEAEAELKRCRDLRPESPEPLVGLAACAEERGDVDLAQNLLGKALKLDAKPEVYNELGNLYLRRKAYKEAQRYFERLVSFNPRDKGAHLKLALCLRMAGKLDEAREHDKIFQALDQEDARRMGPTRRASSAGARP